MISHPLSGYGQKEVDSAGDFSVANIVDADGGYSGDYPAYYEACGDFGTLGQPSLTSEDIGFGRRGPKLIKKKKKQAARPLAHSVTAMIPAVAATTQRSTLPVPAAPIATVPTTSSPITTKPRGLMPSRYATKKYVAAPGSKSGLPRMGIPRQTIPQVRAASVVVPRPAAPQVSTPVVAASLSTIPQVRPPSVTVPEVTRGQVISVPTTQPEQVVSTGGQISQQKIEAAENRAKAQDRARRRRLGITISQEHAHPMSRFSRTMGEENEMGFLKNLWSDTKAKAEEELRKAKEKIQADVKLRVGESISNVSSKILQKPEVQAALAEKTKAGIAQSVAERLLDPEVQKKAAVASVGTLALIGALAYFALRKK
jgi:hypothetical protein